MFPTEKRNHPSIFLRSGGECFLFDCGEGTQTRLRKAKISPAKIGYILITHWHGDHSLGLPGIFQSLSAHSKSDELVIVGPKGSQKKVEHIKKAFGWHQKFSIRVIESSGGKVLEGKDWLLEAIPVKHGIPTLAYSFRQKDAVKINLDYTKKFGLTKHPLLGKLQKGETIEWKGKKITPEKGTYTKPGKKITYITDTLLFPELIDFSKESDVLICEASFMNEHREMAIEKQHLTTGQAGMLAEKSGSSELYVFHVSPRYSNKKKVLDEVKKAFKGAKMPRDLDKIEVK